MVVKQSKYIVKRYPEEHYYTLFDQSSGFFARVEEKGYPEPIWSQHGPELMDISITNWCDRGCDFCYKQSAPDGIHMNLTDYESIMKQAVEMDVLQVALGGGNPNQHPDFIRILKLTREKYGIVPSYTTNGRGLTDEILQTSKECCGAVAISAYEPYCQMEVAIDKLLNYGIKANIHFVLTSQSVETAINWLNNPPAFLNKINAIIFLNYKPIGREPKKNLLLNNSERVPEFFDLIAKDGYSFKIGFDSCLVSGIAKHTNIDLLYYSECDSGKFSLYVSENMKLYPCSFMIDYCDGIKINDNNILDEWLNHDIFDKSRNSKINSECKICKFSHRCKGGCSVFPHINLC